MTTQGSWPSVPGIAYGGDYNPEQWPRATWDEDVALMREAGVNLVSVGIFSWGLIEISEGVFDFGWLDEVIDLLHTNGISVDLGTPTASAPAWMFANYPEARAVRADGVALGFGSRGMMSHSHPAYRTAVARIAGALAERYAAHPGVVMWHVHNEYGVPVGEDFSPASVAAWREWLADRYGSLDGLNAAWGTAFWGQHYDQWEHVIAPAVTASTPNPAMKLDWARFTDDQLRACYRAERDAIRAFSDKPVTTNFMAHQSWNLDLWKWAREVDIVANDHYLWAQDPESHVGLALAADLTRSVAGGAPWILMEHSTSAVNWQGRNIAKSAGEMCRNSLSHFARGADAILFFQWRASRSGAEKFHSAMLPHAGADSRVFREVVDLGGRLGALEEAKGSRVDADVAVLYDWESLWAQDLEWRPSDDAQFRERMRTYYERLWRDGVTVDFAHPTQDLGKYKMVVAPASYLLTADAGENLARYVEAGGTLVVSYFSGVVDEHESVHEGGYGAPLKAALGVTVAEYLPMRESETAKIAWTHGDGLTLAADTWQEDLVLDGAEVIGTYVDGPAAGSPAITRNSRGAGHGWYVSTHLSVDELGPLMAAAYADAGMVLAGNPEGLEVVTRQSAEADYLVAINHCDAPVTVAASGTEMFTGRSVARELTIVAGGCAVVRTTKSHEGGER
ncbi:beta-galactosidase [Demequina aurantiaca]|uniref:beta-galactosidase n=1 Tax=Demequina aurantiaca TaxID=676200 RepID=UPI000780A6BF|nr:beta-galactosidase [Demequina aurantiaca]